MTYASEMRDQANEAEVELIALVGFAQAKQMVSGAVKTRQNGPDDMSHYWLTVICNRRAEAAAAERRSGITINRSQI